MNPHDQGLPLASEDTPRNFTIWQELKNTLQGTDADYTKISLKRAIFLLAVPIILEMVMESTFAVVDIFFISSLAFPTPILFTDGGWFHCSPLTVRAIRVHQPTSTWCFSG